MAAIARQQPTITSLQLFLGGLGLLDVVCKDIPPFPGHGDRMPRPLVPHRHPRTDGQEVLHRVLEVLNRPREEEDLVALRRPSLKERQLERADSKSFFSSAGAAAPAAASFFSISAFSAMKSLSCTLDFVPRRSCRCSRRLAVFFHPFAYGDYLLFRDLLRMAARDVVGSPVLPFMLSFAQLHLHCPIVPCVT